MDNSAAPAIDISIVAPVYNEEAVLESFCKAVLSVLDSQRLSYEVILVDDGSRDGTWSIIEKLCGMDTRVKAIHFSRNFGQQAALSAGIEAARGGAVVTMDADLQHPPQEIPRMIEAWKGGASIVTMNRERTGRLPFVKRTGTALFYHLINKWSEIPLGYNMPDFRLMDRAVVDSFVGLRERSRFVRGLVHWLGFSPVVLHFRAGADAGKTTHYNFRTMAHLAMDAITSFTSFPLRLALYAGIVISLLSTAYLFYALYVAIFLRTAAPGWTSLISVVLFLGGCQMVFMGIIGEYLSRVYIEVKQRPLYVEKERKNF